MTDFEPAVRRIATQVRGELNATAPRNATTVTLHLTVGAPEPGHWCGTCLLPSAAEFPLHGLHQHGVIPLGRVRACPDCGQVDRTG